MTARGRTKLLAHLPHTDCCFGQLFGQTSVAVVVFIVTDIKNMFVFFVFIGHEDNLTVVKFTITA